MKMQYNDSFQADGNQTPDKQNFNPNQFTTNQNGFSKGGNTSTSTSNKYSSMLIIYSAIFFALFIAAYFILKYKDLKINARNGTILILTLLWIGLFLRISAATLIEGQSGDLNLFKT